MTNTINTLKSHHINAQRYEHDDVEYVILTGTGDALGGALFAGAWAMRLDEVTLWLESVADVDFRASEDRFFYSELCDAVDVVETRELALALFGDLDLLLNQAGVCQPVFDAEPRVIYSDDPGDVLAALVDAADIEATEADAAKRGVEIVASEVVERAEAAGVQVLARARDALVQFLTESVSAMESD